VGEEKNEKKPIMREAGKAEGGTMPSGSRPLSDLKSWATYSFVISSCYLSAVFSSCR
jgi:hypothetical protein